MDICPTSITSLSITSPRSSYPDSSTSVYDVLVTYLYRVVDDCVQFNVILPPAPDRFHLGSVSRILFFSLKVMDSTWISRLPGWRARAHDARAQKKLPHRNLQELPNLDVRDATACQHLKDGTLGLPVRGFYLFLLPITRILLAHPVVEFCQGRWLSEVSFLQDGS